MESIGESAANPADLAAFIGALSVDAVEHGSQWENLSIPEMLESMEAWLAERLDHDPSSVPTLGRAEVRFVVELLLAGKHYE